MKWKLSRSTCRRGNFSAFKEHRSGSCVPTFAFPGNAPKDRRREITANVNGEQCEELKTERRPTARQEEGE
jgi:hypothetical protein